MSAIKPRASSNHVKGLINSEESMRFARFFMLQINLTLLLVLFFDSNIWSQCSPVLIFTGEDEIDQFGSSVSGAGDVNNDGFPDLVVGAAGYDVLANNLSDSLVDAGRAYIYSGANGDLLYTFDGATKARRLGSSVSGAGDVNNDGFADVIVAAWGNISGSGNPEHAIVYSGANGAALYTFTGESIGDVFAISVSGAGDVNNDGFDDLIVGASNNDAAGLNAGRAYVYSGANGALLHTLDAEAVGDRFGVSVSGAGDVNNDGFADVIVGANGNDAGGNDAGRAYVYSGANGALLHTFTGEFSGDFFGRSVSDAGDVNNDGFADLIVGAYESDVAAFNAGRAYVYSGANGALLFTFDGEAAGNEAGRLVSGAGDVNNDGFDDLIVGAHKFGAAGTRFGRAYVYSGNTGALLHTLTGEAEGDLFAFSASGAGDIDSDGFADLIVGAALNDGGGFRAGRAYVYSLADPDNDLITSSCDNCPATSNANQADTDSDGIGDVCDDCPNDPDNDIDGDGVCGDIDNCPNDSNTPQTDSDGDGIGNSCDTCPNDPDNDIDADGICGNIDNCPNVANPLQTDSDGDSVGDLCDNCPQSANESQTDADGDEIGDVCDNCPADFNPGQEDANSNDIGDVCDGCCIAPGDANHTGTVNIADVTFLIARIFAGGPAPDCCEEGDANGDGSVNIADVTYLIARIFAGGPAPICGPNGMGC